MSAKEKAKEKDKKEKEKDKGNDKDKELLKSLETLFRKEEVRVQLGKLSYFFRVDTISINL